jgi:ribosomal protein S14
MRHSSASDKLLRKTVQQQQARSRFLKSIRSNFFLAPSTRAGVAGLLFFLKSRSRVHNFCVISSRSRSVLREFKLSRLEFKRLAGMRLISGVKRSSY